MKHILYLTKKLHRYAGTILYINLLGMVIISLLEGIGIFLLFPLLSMSGFLNVTAGANPIWGLFDFLQTIPKAWGLPLVLGLYTLLAVSQTLLQRNLTIREVKIHTGFLNHLRLETYRSLLQANWDFFIKKRKSDLINSLTTELGRVGGGLRMLLQFIASLIFTFIQIGIAFWLSSSLTLFVLGCGLLLALFSRKYIKRSNVLGNQTSELSQSYLAGITEHFNGIKDIKSNMLEESRYHWLLSWCRQIEQERIENFKLKSNSQLFYKISMAIIVAGFIFFSVTMFHSQLEQLILIILIFSRLWPRFTSIQSNLEEIASCSAAFNALIGLQKECNSARELENINHSNNKVKPIQIKHGLECSKVHFRYNPSVATYSLQDISLQIPANCMTAIVGRSGAGKSTLIDIIMGLLKPESGMVLIDGAPLNRDNLLSLRRSISYIPQDPFLFNGSIKENMQIIEPDATEAQMWEALEFAAAAEFVGRLPFGMDTLIGDRGIRLSGGERQRLVLARAILRKPAILVLDEATSALDTENETKIQGALDKLRGTMTIIVIAHRLSTVRNADQVIVLDQGKIIQKGAFNQLAKEKEGLFSSLLGNQMRDSKVISLR
ncbi:MULTISPECIES: ABC transporter ATP-binding protein [unclassified Paenibacillus]|uniref:ABC transporter ATP-binding protein n=1 Tax=unclassified Paenibacillus TaxID=185978 RepID=UPI00362E90DF